MVGTENLRKYRLFLFVGTLLDLTNTDKLGL